jgi:hypothetical protein
MRTIKESPLYIAVYRPHCAVTFEYLNNELADMQSLVVGAIEFVTLSRELAMVCNEEGKLFELPLNRFLADKNGDIFDSVHGTFFVARFDIAAGELKSLRSTDESLLKEWKPLRRWAIKL